MKNETKKELEEFLESDDSEDYRDDSFHYLFLDCDNCEDHSSLHEVPYWIEEYSKDEYLCEYVSGYWNNLEKNEEVTIEGKKLKFIDFQLLPEEVEHQAENGDLCYEYRGPSFLRIFRLQ